MSRTIAWKGVTDLEGVGEIEAPDGRLLVSLDGENVVLGFDLGEYPVEVTLPPWVAGNLGAELQRAAWIGSDRRRTVNAHE